MLCRDPGIKHLCHVQNRTPSSSSTSLRDEGALRPIYLSERHTYIGRARPSKLKDAIVKHTLIMSLLFLSVCVCVTQPSYKVDWPCQQVEARVAWLMMVSTLPLVGDGRDIVNIKVWTLPPDGGRRVIDVESGGFGNKYMCGLFHQVEES